MNCTCTQGWIVGEDGLARRCPCRKITPMMRLLRAGVSFYDAGHTLDEMLQTDKPQWRRMQHALKVLRGGDGVVFFGPVGTGKTCAAAAIAKELMGEGLDVTWLYFPTWLDEIRDSHREGATVREGIILEQAVRVPVLVADDVGLGRMTAYVAEVVTKLIHRRKGKATLVTTNLGMGDGGRSVREALGAAAHSRLREYAPFEFRGRDRRKPRRVDDASQDQHPHPQEA